MKSENSTRNIKFVLRGAPFGEQERKQLYLKAERLIKSVGISMPYRENWYDFLRENGVFGYGTYYLVTSYDNSELLSKADLTIYKQLLEIDAKLGTTPTEQLFECVLFSARMDLVKVRINFYMLLLILFKEFEMEKIDFGHVWQRGGLTIYNSCFQRYIYATETLKRPENDCSMLISNAETMFMYFVQEGSRYGFDVDSILEIPSSIGLTCFALASRLSSSISNFLIGRGIKVNSITTAMMVPEFNFPDLTLQMMLKGINPYVIDYEEKSQINLNPSFFESEEAKQLLDHFPRSIHFSIDDITCTKSCSPNCSSNLKKFYFKNGDFVNMSDENHIGQGGFGSVFKGKFHDEDKAMKCVFIGEIQPQTLTENAVSDLEKNIAEIRIQMASGGSGILVPDALIRQQNQEQNDNGEWIAENYNIYIYPLYDCNLSELHMNYYDQFTNDNVTDILQQCLNR